MEETEQLDLTECHLLVTRDDRPVRGAEVCMKVDARGRRSASATAANVAREVSPGRYELELTLSVAGSWRGHAIVTEPGQRPVSVPVDIESAPVEHGAGTTTGPPRTSRVGWDRRPPLRPGGTI